MSRWLKEPLLHFVLLGGLIFAVSDYLAEDRLAPDEIVISKGQQQNLLNTFTRTWQRQPTPREFQGLVQDLLRQEIAYREGRKMGLDEGDIVIRRRLRQKLEMLAEDVISLAPPDDTQLRQFLEDNPGRFERAARYRLRQVYISTERRGEQAGEFAESLLARLQGESFDAAIAERGDPLPLPEILDDVRSDELERLFGSQFSEQIASLEPGSWAGPVRSGYGLHLVYVSDRIPPSQPRLAEVREAVQREYLAEQRTQVIDAMYEKLAADYSIDIEPLLDLAEEDD